MITIGLVVIAALASWNKNTSDIDNLRRDLQAHKLSLNNDFVRKDVFAERDRALMSEINLMRRQLERIEAKFDK